MRLCVLALLLSALAAVAAAQTPVDVQPGKNLNSTDAGSCDYKPLPREKPYFKNLSPGEALNGSSTESYSIHGKTGRYIGWYGIVRGITPADHAGGEVTVLVEHKFFDGLTDCGIMVVSFSGGGDFQAGLQVDPAAIPPLSLVRIYGVVTGEKDNVPQVMGQYMRVWPWLTFTFTKFGPQDQSNARWGKYATTEAGWKVHDPSPAEDYYRRALGDPAQFGVNLKPE
jgi:hypothetical protein